jgi:hypothetical protein
LLALLLGVASCRRWGRCSRSLGLGTLSHRAGCSSATSHRCIESPIMRVIKNCTHYKNLSSSASNPLDGSI